MNLESRKILQVILFIFALTALAVLAGSRVYYNHQVQDIRARLVEQAGNRARLLEALHRRFQDEKRVMEIFREYQEGLKPSFQTWQVVVGRRNPDRRIEILYARGVQGEIAVKNLPIATNQAQPMRLALAGKSGIEVGVDYRGVQVLGAHEPVAGLGWGVVCKVDREEYQAPVWESLQWSLWVALICALLAYPILIRIAQPLLAQSRESERRLKTILSVTMDGIGLWEMGPGGVPGPFREVNDAFLRITGYSRSDVMRLTPVNLMAPDMTREFPGHLERLAKEKKIVVECMLSTKNGQRVPVEVGMGLIQAEGREQVLCFIHDITERKRREAQVVAAMNLAADNEKRIQEVFDAASDALFVHEVNPDGTWGRFLEVNESACRYLGYSRQELKTMSIPDVVVPGHGTKSAPEIFREVREKGTVHFESMHRAKDGREIPVEVHSKYFETRGKALVISSVHDISERRQKEAVIREMMEKLNEQNAQLRKLDQMKDDFLSAISHELRTPLTSIKGYLKLLTGGMAGPLNDEQRDYAQTAASNSDRLLELINDLLDLSRLESGRAPLHLADEPVEAVLRNAVGVVKNLAAQKKVSLEVSPPEPKATAHVDREKMERLLINFLSNAVKFTPAGGRIEVAARRETRDGRPGWVWSVKDTGCGIPEEAVSRVFDKFYQVENANTRKVGGTGLGLAICTKIAEAHGGTVGVESRLGEGSVFFAFIPERPSEKEPS